MTERELIQALVKMHEAIDIRYIAVYWTAEETALLAKAGDYLDRWGDDED